MHRVLATFVAAVTALGWLLHGRAALAASARSAPPRYTTSLYERHASAAALYAQGEQAGRADAAGAVILDFGRPAASGASEGLYWPGQYLSLQAVATLVSAYLEGYTTHAPAGSRLVVAIGTNDSCGTNQPCGSAACGCGLEPASFYDWGASFARSIRSLEAVAVALDHARHEQVELAGADDAEPGFDPEFTNTLHVLQGFAAEPGGPKMIDYGSADPGHWSEAQLFEVAFGLPTAEAMPQIYYPFMASEWAKLVRFARSELHRSVAITGVLTDGGGANSPLAGYEQMLQALAGMRVAHSVAWLSLIE